MTSSTKWLHQRRLNNGMAVVSLWPVKGKVNDLIKYIENPEKTLKNDDFSDFISVIEYAENANKTKDKYYVSAINCMKTTALKEMLLTKKQFDKLSGRVAYHGYQSFKPDELTPDVCHEIGVKYAQEMWGDRYQVIVTTHLDKDHLHNHFAINSVSFLDGKKYDLTNKEMERMREVSDKLCKEYGLSVIDNPKKSPNRMLYLAEKNGEQTLYNVYRNDVREAILNSVNIKAFERFLHYRGYEMDFKNGKYKIKFPNEEHFVNLETLNPKWTNEYINTHTLTYEQRQFRISGKVKYDLISNHHVDYMIWIPHKKPETLLGLLLHYLYLLGHNENKPIKKVHPYLREDLRKVDEYSAMAQLLSKHKLNTDVDVINYIDKQQQEMDFYIAKRQKLRNKYRRADDATKEEIRAEKKQLTALITAYRNDIKLAKKIVIRCYEIENKLNQAYDQNKAIIRETSRDER